MTTSKTTETKLRSERAKAAEARNELMARIAEALAPDNGATSGALRGLASEVAQMIPETKDLAARTREAALDPSVRPEDVANAMAEAGAADFDAERLTAAQDRLYTATDVAQEAETEAVRAERYQAACARRDAAANRILAEYPGLQAQLTDLLREVIEAGLEVDRVNNDLPKHLKPLNRPEGHARGFHDHGATDLPLNFEWMRITQAILPKIDAQNGIAWPPGERHSHLRTGSRFVTFRAVVHGFQKSN